MLFMGFDLGYSDSLELSEIEHGQITTRADPRAGFECAYTIHNWRSTHAYVISRDAMRR